MRRNVELLEATMQNILDHPELHRQDWYFTETDCGTAACFAGWACALSGYRPVIHFGEREGDLVQFPGERGRFGAGGIAQTLLGISDEESTILFYGMNTAAMLQLMVKDLVNGEELRVPDHYRKEAHQ